MILSRIKGLAIIAIAEYRAPVWPKQHSRR